MGVPKGFKFSTARIDSTDETIFNGAHRRNLEDSFSISIPNSACCTFGNSRIPLDVMDWELHGHVVGHVSCNQETRTGLCHI
jgi:hypothetical protein